VVSDEESHGRMSLSRKVDLLNVRDANEEFEMKSKCLRRKSLDFEKDRVRQRLKIQRGSTQNAISNLNKLIVSEEESENVIGHKRGKTMFRIKRNIRKES